MLAKAKGTVIVACVLLCTLSLLAGRTTMPPRPKMPVALPPAGAAGTSAVLVEAFVVEVNLPALGKLNVSPLGQEPHAVSVAEIFPCLETGQARVLGGGKVACQPEARATVETTNVTYIGSEKSTPPAPPRAPYQTIQKFAFAISSVSETAAAVQFSVTQVRHTHPMPASEAASATGNWDWSGVTTLDLGKPQIVAAAQDSETAVFLILTAHVQGE